MTHRDNISIPARFTFRPFKAEWIPVTAEIIGWHEEPRPQPGVWAPPPIGPVSKSKLAKPLLELEQSISNRVRVSVDVPTPQELEAFCGAMLWASSYEIEIDHANIPREVLSANENHAHTPNRAIEGRQFDVLACPLPEFESPLFSPKPEGGVEDAWTMRREFFKLEEETWALSLFLSHWGLWNYSRGYFPARSGGMVQELRAEPFLLVYPHLVWERREQFRRALAGKSHTWLSTARPLSLTTANEPPYFSVAQNCCEEAIEATITIDLFNKAKFGICKRKDCRNLFQRKTKQKRLYCSLKCAHLANVRKLRAEQKKAEAKRRNHATRKN
jgi:hypothetical protein